MTPRRELSHGSQHSYQTRVEKDIKPDAAAIQPTFYQPVKQKTPMRSMNSMQSIQSLAINQPSLAKKKLNQHSRGLGIEDEKKLKK